MTSGCVQLVFSVWKDIINRDLMYGITNVREAHCRASRCTNKSSQYVEVEVVSRNFLGTAVKVNPVNPALTCNT